VLVIKAAAAVCGRDPPASHSNILITEAFETGRPTVPSRPSPATRNDSESLAVTVRCPSSAGANPACGFRAAGELAGPARRIASLDSDDVPRPAHYSQPEADRLGGSETGPWQKSPESPDRGESGSHQVRPQWAGSVRRRAAPAAHGPGSDSERPGRALAERPPTRAD
jgi:hypothetical protein